MFLGSHQELLQDSQNQYTKGNIVTKWFNLFKCQPHKLVKHTRTIWLLPTNCLSVFDHFVGLALTGLSENATL